MAINNINSNNAANMTDIPALNFALQADQQMDLSKLSKEQINRVNQIVASVSLTGTNSWVSFAVEPQRKLSQYLDQLLEGMRTSEAGRAGDITIALASTLKDLHLSKVKEEVAGQSSLSEMFGKIPVLGQWFSALQALQMNHKKITEHLTNIETQAQSRLTSLKAMSDKFDRMVECSIEHIRELELYLAAGQIIIKKSRLEFEQRRLAIEQSRDAVEISRLHDFAEQLNAFETRVVRLNLAYSESIIAVPEIRTSQAASLIEMNNVMDSLLFDLPRLKRAILSVSALANIAKASRETKARHELSRELSKIGSEELQNVYLKAKESQGDFTLDIAVLAQSADKLLETIELGRKMDIANVTKREKAIADLSHINATFTEGLLIAGDRFVENA